MPQVLPWYCPHTDQLFGSKDRYREHLKEMAAERYDLRMRRLRATRATGFINANLYRVHSLDALKSFIIEHAEKFYLMGLQKDGNRLLHPNPRWRSKLAADYAFTEVTFNLRPTFSPHTVRDATGACLSGRLRYRYEFTAGCDTPLNPFSGTRILTGSGGGTSSHDDGKGVMRYDIALMEEDWPNLFVGQKLAEAV